MAAGRSFTATLPRPFGSFRPARQAFMDYGSLVDSHVGQLLEAEGLGAEEIATQLNSLFRTEGVGDLGSAQFLLGIAVDYESFISAVKTLLLAEEGSAAVPSGSASTPVQSPGRTQHCSKSTNDSRLWRSRGDRTREGLRLSQPVVSAGVRSFL